MRRGRQWKGRLQLAARSAGSFLRIAADTASERFGSALLPKAVLTMEVDRTAPLTDGGGVIQSKWFVFLLFL